MTIIQEIPMKTKSKNQSGTAVLYFPTDVKGIMCTNKKLVKL